MNEQLDIKSVPVDSSKLERIVEFHPAYDKRDPDPSKNYGIHGMEILFVLKGPAGAVVWLIYTNWNVPSARSLRPNHSMGIYGRPFMGADLGYHALVSQYEEQEERDCCYTSSGKCYYVGSGLNAELLVENFIAQGDKYLWAALEAYYRTCFEEAPWPFDDQGNIKESQK